MTVFQKIGKYVGIFLKYFSLVFFSFVAVLPVVSCVITAFKTDTEYQQTNVMVMPESWLNFDNFIQAFQRANMGRAFINSTIILVCVLVVSTIVGTQLAYVLNRFKFPGNGLIRNLFLFASLLPGVAMQVAVYEIYNRLMEANGLPALPSVPLEKRLLEYEDVYPMLYLKYRLCKGESRRTIRHLVIDEMQDYSYLQYVILEKLFDCRMTILGDKAQTVDTRQQDVLKFLPKIFGRDVRKIEMNKSYRNTIEIAEYARNVSDVKGIEYMQRHGKPVEDMTCSTPAAALDDILGKVRIGGDRYETAAVLTMTEREAKEAFSYLKNQREDVCYIDRDSSVFRKGITVTTYYMAKGLEFDQVFVAGGQEKNPFFKQFRYICATRALHELYVYESE